VDEHFPSLSASGYTPTSPESVDYNCVAWAAEDVTRWWWPDMMELSYWPENVPRQATLAAFQQAFAALGYVPSEGDSLDGGAEKVAIYARDDSPTHMARQLTTGQWSSKLGASIDLSHTLAGLEGPLYGRVVAIMQRQRQPHDTLE
jgi:hypothetical protein